MDKTLSVAFIWHMHQPSYKDKETNLYIMPWVRLHAVKDYLDMLLILDEFPNIKQTFNLVPLLIDQLEDYANNEAHDIHSKLTVRDIVDFTQEDKLFVLGHFFDANYTTQIEPHEEYAKLYQRAYVTSENLDEKFSDQDYSDIMMWFNLVWFDPSWVEKIPELKAFKEKGKDFSFEDRKRLIEIQREIISQIIPSYRKYWEEGKIEISTSPYYHPIIPLLINYDEEFKSASGKKKTQLEMDAKDQVLKSFEKFEKVFGNRPKGIWPSEQCIDQQTLKLFASLGVNWTISDEGVLSKTLKKEFVRNYRGVNEDPFDICQAYSFGNDSDKIKVVFRDAVLSGLISFEYGNHEPDLAANDLYERIKIVQSKLNSSPKKNHLLTIALDGENCWESYKDDGVNFIKKLYKLLNEDNSLCITTVSDYLAQDGEEKTLKAISSGSWINRNFEMWIGDPIKNLAWDYLSKTKADFLTFTEQDQYNQTVIDEAKEEIFIAEGSDWFWWYGEPNDSGRDELFDMMFRKHLQGVYKILNKSIPDYLNIPLETFAGKPSKFPRGLISPKIDGKIKINENAGRIDIPDSPTYSGDKVLDKICYGNNKDKMFFSLYVNKHCIEDSKSSFLFSEINIYLSKKEATHYSPVRIRNGGDKIPQVLKYGYTHEMQIPISRGQILPIIFSESIDDSLWKINLLHHIEYCYDEVFDCAIPFDSVGIQPGERVYFVITTGKVGILNQSIPLDKAIYIERPL